MEREYIEAPGGVPGASGSPWLAPPAAQRPSIIGDHTADAIVVGAGIVGALVAFELASRGLKVALLERRRIAGGTTGHSTAKITVLHGTQWSTRLARRRSDAALSEWAGLNAEAPAAFGDLITSRSIECGFRRLDAHLVAATPAAEASVVSELNALRRLGVQVEDLGRMPDSPLGDTRGIRIAGQAQFDAAAFTVGLIDSLPGDQVTVAEDSPVRDLDREGRMWCARLDNAVVRAPYAVMTALAPVRDPALLFTRLYPYAAYAFEFMPASPPPDGFWLQAGDDGVTLRPTDRPDGSWIAGGQHIRLASEADERVVYQRLYRAVESRFPGCRPIRHWSTHDLSTPDDVPFVGRVGSRDGLYMIGGFGGWGMSESLPAARLLADAILGAAREPLLRLLSPNRLPGLYALPTFLRENAAVARRLLLPSAEQRHAAAGSVVAAQGSAPPRCTHLHCRLKVDGAEGTLNCPCHGSRFTGGGGALYGPAQRDLSRVPRQGRGPASRGR